MVPKISNILFVLNIIDLNLVHFSDLKVILNIKLLHPVRVQTVRDHLSEAELLPHRTHLFVQNRQAIRTSEGIKIGQVDALEGEPYSVD